MNFKLFLIFLTLVFLKVYYVSAQEKSRVSGVIKDNGGIEMPGVNVTIKGTTDGTITDIDGKFEVEVKPEDVLIFSFIGFEDQEVKVGTQTKIDIVLVEGGKELEEVVITGFGEVKRRLYTGSSESLTMDKIKQDGVADVSQMLQGRAAGVTVSTVSSTFGAAPKISIRGVSTINGDGKPLWVIDGVVQEDIANVTNEQLSSGNNITLISSSIAGLNPNDIESIEILKDASATAIYGSRSLNGVVVITTKRGVKNQPLSINYNTEFVTREKPTYANKNLMNSKENIELLLEMEEKGLFDVITIKNRKNSGVFGILANQLSTYNPTTGDFNVKNTQEDRYNFLRKYEQANTDWFDLLFRNTITQSHTLSLSSGNDKVNAFASIGYYNDPGWTIADKVERYTVNLKNTYTIFKKTKLTFNILGSYRKQRAPGVNDANTLNPFNYALRTSRTLRPYDDNGNLEYYTRNYTPFNIIEETKNNYLDLNVQDVKMQVEFNTPLYKDKLKYSMVSSLRFVKTERQYITTERSNQANVYRATQSTAIIKANDYLYKPIGTSDSFVALPNGGFYIGEDNYLENLYVRNTLTYSDNFGSDHEIDIFAGQELRVNNRDYDYFYGYGLDYGKGLLATTHVNIFKRLLEVKKSQYYGLSTSKERSVSIFSRATYGYLGKYFVSLTTNFNAANTQLDVNRNPRWAPTWTVSGKWNAKEENFLKNIDLISQLQGRIAYGLTAAAGNANNFSAVYKNVNQSRGNGNSSVNAINIENLQNLDLAWEKQYELNAGFDISLLKNRISIAFDGYRRNGFDQFATISVQALGGQYSKYINNADMETVGFELSITTTNIKTNDFNWSTTFNVSKYDQQITSIKQNTTVNNLVDPDDRNGNLIGFPRNALFSLKYNGLNNVGMPTFTSPLPDKTYNNFLNYTKEDLDGGFTPYLKYEGPLDANQQYGLYNNFSYKNWTLNIFVTGSFGNKKRLRINYTRLDDDGSNSEKQNDRWIVSGDEKKTDVPTIPDYRTFQAQGLYNIGNAFKSYYLSDINVVDGGFIRLKSIKLSYEMPKSICEQIRIKGMTSSILVHNVMLMYSDDKLNGIDPEFTNSGGVASPITRQYTLSLNFRF